MRKAQIDNGVVVNIIEVDPDSVPDWCADWPDADATADIGGTYEKGVFVAPAKQAPAVPASISFAQLLIGLVSEGWITADEGRAWRDRVALPTPVTKLISALPEAQRFAAETRALAPSEVLRLDPLVMALGAAQGKTEAELDAFFATYSAV